MPLEIAHLQLAQSAMPMIQPTDPQLFLLGSVWPDIRYPAKIDRAITHVQLIPAGVSLPFAQGVWFHRWTDRIWDETASRICGKEFFVSGETVAVLKLGFEHYYESGTVDFLPETPTSDELEWGVAPELIRTWHQFLREYLPSMKSDGVYESIAVTLGLPIELAKQFRIKVSQQRQQPGWHEKMAALATAMKTEIGTMILAQNYYL